MSPAENAFNAIYPTVLRVTAIHRRIMALNDPSNIDIVEELCMDLKRSLDDLVMQVEGIEAGQIDDSLTTSLAGVLNQLRLRSRHN